MSTDASDNRLNRIHSLDALRGIAALAVVFSHWKRFDNNQRPGGAVDRTASPFYDLARPQYEQGWLIVEATESKFRWRLSSKVTLTVLVLIWGLALAEAYGGILTLTLTGIAEPLLGISHTGPATVAALRLAMIFTLFPITILALVTLEARGLLNWTRRLGPLGDVSYPVYLLHFPIQCIVVFVARAVGGEMNYANTPLFMAGFLLILLVSAALSAHWFGRPDHYFIRHRFSRSNLSENRT